MENNQCIIGFFDVVKHKNEVNTKFDICLQGLSETEQQSVLKFKFQEDRNRSLYSQFLAKHVMNSQIFQNPSLTPEYISTLKSSLNFLRTPQGKPYLSPNPNSIHFNWSHAGDLVLLGVMKNSSQIIGVDIEVVSSRKDNIPNFLASFKCVLSSAEWAWINKREAIYEHPEFILQRFFLIWTLKESFMKATGMGFLFGVERMDFYFELPDNANNNPYSNFSDKWTKYINAVPKLKVDGIDVSNDWSFCTKGMTDCKGGSYIACVAVGPKNDKYLGKDFSKAILDASKNDNNISQSITREKLEECLKNIKEFTL